jgi:hypothetical protein
MSSCHDICNIYHTRFHTKDATCMQAPLKLHVPNHSLDIGTAAVPVSRFTKLKDLKDINTADTIVTIVAS